MWNEAEFLKPGLVCFGRNDHPRARALLLCDTSVNTCIVVSANLLPKSISDIPLQEWWVSRTVIHCLVEGFCLINPEILAVTAKQMFYRMKSCTLHRAEFHPSERKAQLCQAGLRPHALTVQTQKLGTASVRVNTLCMWFSQSEFELGKNANLIQL